MESRRVLATFLVTTTADVVDANDAVTSLREAIGDSNQSPGIDTISFDPGVFQSRSEIDLLLGQLEVTDGVSISGPGQHLLTVDAQNLSRVINFDSAAGDLVITGVTLTGGQTTQADVNSSASGGAVRFTSTGTLTFNDAAIIGNRTIGGGARGGAIFADAGNVVLNRSVVSENQTSGIGGRGGGIFAASGTVSLVDSTLSSNATVNEGSSGGGIHAAGGTVALIQSVVKDNRTSGDSSDGGAVFAPSGVTIDASIVTGNVTTGSDSDGGAVFSSGTLTVSQSDVSFNRTDGAYSSGGALAFDTGIVTVLGSSITANQTTQRQSYGAGLFAVRSDVTITQSTISGNLASGTASDGGGVSAFFSSVAVTASTITGNSTPGVGGGIAFTDNQSNTIDVRNSIIAGNAAGGTGPDLTVPLNPSLLAVQSSLIGDNTGTMLAESQTPDLDGNFIGDPAGMGVINPLLAPLLLSGTTRVHPLTASSLAVDSGDNSLVTTLVHDQRGEPFQRISGATVDMGSFERQAFDATAFVVTTSVDEFNFSNNSVSLREAIAVANGIAGEDEISFDPVVFSSPTSIDLQLGELWITDSLSIAGPGKDLLAIDAVDASRVVSVADGDIDLTIAGLSVRGGRTTAPHEGGAGVRFESAGTLTINDSDVVDNHTLGDRSSGGGIASRIGPVVIQRSVVLDNSTTGDQAGGGGVHGGGGVFVVDSTIAGNATHGVAAPGGGIAANRLGRDAVMLTRTTVSGNSTLGAGSHGGGIAVGAGGVRSVNSTVSGNSAAGDGGGIAAADAAARHRVVSSTIALNSSGGSGGGIRAASDNGGSLLIQNSIVATNTDSGSAPDISTVSVTVESSLIGDNSGTLLDEAQTADPLGNLIGASLGGGTIDPRLQPLAHRGGWTETHSLSTDSPAVDAGDALLLGQLATDQRGEPFKRVAGVIPDMGAYEVQSLDDALLVVTTAVDVMDFEHSQLSLREALQLSAGSEGVETIVFDPATFAQASTIPLALGPLQILDSVNIVGPGRGVLAIDGGGNSRILEITTGDFDVLVEGLTMRGGRTSGDNSFDATSHSGGAIRVDPGGTVTLRDVQIENNRTIGGGAGGGAVFVHDAALAIENSILSDNRTEGAAADGGAIHIRGGSLDIVNTTISANHTDGGASGGAIAVFSGQSGPVDVTIIGTTIADNGVSGNAALGGGIAMQAAGGSLSLHESIIRDNSSSAFHAQGIGIFAADADVSIYGSRIASNVASGDTALGAGMFITRSTLAVMDSAVIDNRLIGDDTLGAGMHLSAVVARITNTTVAANVAPGSNSIGGGIAAGSATVIDVVNTTVTNNSATQRGGGIATGGDAASSLTVHNSIIAQNGDSAIAPDLLQGTTSTTMRSSLLGDNAGTSFAESQTSDAMGNLVGSSAGGGVIDPMLSPLAINGGTTETREPLAGSPVLDAGDDALAIDADAMPLQSDQRGAPFTRIVGTVDMGSFEVQPPREPIILWSDPDSIFVGTPLTSAQLDAAVNTSGTFVYTPGPGTILGLGDNQTLMVEFTPDDTGHYTSASASVAIDVVERLDLGDAPDSYGTLRSSDGPRHVVGELRLGSLVDADTDGQPDGNASGDGSDEDGITFLTNVVATDLAVTGASVLVSASARAKLDAWIDFNADGVFDPVSEHLAGGTSIDVFSGNNVVSFAVPAGAMPGTTMARFRISSDGGLLPTGAATDGEVEDYAIQIDDGAASPVVDVQLPRGNVSLSGEAGDLVLRRSSNVLFGAPSSTVGRFRILGDEFSKVLTIDQTGGAAIPQGGLFYDGMDRINTVRLTGPHAQFDISRQGNVELRNIAAIDITDPSATTLRIDSRAARAMDPRGGGVVVVGSSDDGLVIVDGTQWRMDDPVDVAGESFSVVRLSDTFVQADFVSPWQNLAQPGDVNNDGEVTANDALRIINELARRSFSDPDTGQLNDPASVSPWPGSYYDQTGDGLATALDALRVINQLARDASGAGEGELSTASYGSAASGQPAPRYAGTRQSTWMASRSEATDQLITEFAIAGAPPADNSVPNRSSVPSSSDTMAVDELLSTQSLFDELRLPLE